VVTNFNPNMTIQVTGHAGNNPDETCSFLLSQTTFAPTATSTPTPAGTNTPTNTPRPTNTPKPTKTPRQVAFR